jgi:hypothetical protein
MWNYILDRTVPAVVGVTIAILLSSALGLLP